MMTRTARVLGSALRSIARNRLRTFFIMLGTFVGVAALTVILAIGRGTRQQVLDSFERLLSGSSILLAAGAGHERGGPRDAATTTLTLEDVRAIDDALDEVILADPVVPAGPRDVAYGGRSDRISILGHSEAAAIAFDRPVTRGAHFTAEDVASAARVALVGTVVARELFQGRDPVGQQIRIAGLPFRVMGVLAPIGVDPHGIDKDDEIIIPISTMMRRVLEADHVQWAKFVLRPGEDVDAAVLEITDILRRRHRIVPGEPDDFAMFTPVHVRQRVAEASRVFTVFLPLVAALSIVVGGLVAANLMLIAASERRAEIGLRMAVGARPRDIRLQFLAESIAVTALAGAAAVLAGLAVLRILAHTSGTPAGMPWRAALLGLAVSITVGVAAGVLPARRAAALDPVRTLR